MSEWPLISICIPVYNRVEIISVALKSALAQDYPNIEVIVSDNFSNDGTYEWLVQFVKTDSRIQLLRMPRNEGAVRNWLNCLSRAKGEYVKFLWSDDVIAPNFLSECFPMLKDDVAFVYTSIQFFWKDVQELSEKTRYGLSREGYFPSEIFIRGLSLGQDFPVSASCALFRTASFAKALSVQLAPNPYQLDSLANGAGPDAFLFLSPALDYPKFAHIPRPLCYLGAGFDSISVLEGEKLRPFYYYAYWYLARHFRPDLMSKVKAFGIVELWFWRANTPARQVYAEIAASCTGPVDCFFLISRTAINFGRLGLRNLIQGGVQIKRGLKQLLGSNRSV